MRSPRDPSVVEIYRHNTLVNSTDAAGVCNDTCDRSRGRSFGGIRVVRWALRCGLARRPPQVREEREVPREHAEGEQQVEGAVSQPYLRVEEEELGGEEDRQNKGFP